jgi:hypothetical protein
MVVMGRRWVVGGGVLLEAGGRVATKVPFPVCKTEKISYFGGTWEPDGHLDLPWCRILQTVLLRLPCLKLRWR